MGRCLHKDNASLFRACHCVIEQTPLLVVAAMDAELDSDASDLRRQRNIDSLRTYQMKSDAFIVYLHYFVPRVSEDHSWLTDETVDVFSRLANPPPPFPAFPDAPIVENNLPAWRQGIGSSG